MGSLETNPVIGLDMGFRIYQSRNNTSPVATTDFMTESIILTGAIISTAGIMRNRPWYPRLVIDLDRGWRN